MKGKVDLILHRTNPLKLRHDHFVSAGRRVFQLFPAFVFLHRTVSLGLLHDGIASETNVGDTMIFSLCDL